MKLFLSIICVIIFPGLIKNLISVINDLRSSPALIYFIIGIMVGIGIFQIIIKPNYGIKTFLHESSHAVIAILFLRRIEKFVATSNEGGYVRHSRGFGENVGNMIILLSPYFFPLLTFFSLIIKFLIPIEFWHWSNLLTGVCISVDIQQNITELKFNWHSNSFKLAGTNEFAQTDIVQVGRIPSIILIVSMWILLYTLFIDISINGLAGSSFLFHSIYHSSLNLLSKIVSLLLKYFQLLVNFLTSLLG